MNKMTYLYNTTAQVKSVNKYASKKKLGLTASHYVPPSQQSNKKCLKQSFKLFRVNTGWTDN